MVIDCSFINLRKRPNVNSSSQARIYAGQKVKLIGWYGKFAKVKYNGKTGYVMASYIAPANQFMDTALDTVQVTEVYSYEQMLQDLISFDMRYPDLVELEIVGESAMGRQIPAIRVGDENASFHILLHGGIHGREHMTTWTLMALLDYWLDQDLFTSSDVCYHFIPMVNPDGVTISQTGVLPDSLMSVYKNDLKMGYTDYDVTEYARQWKANGQGVDLNRNFDAGWETITERTAPSSERYRGEAPFSAPEAAMLRDYTLRYSFNLTVSYHAMGSMIYFEYGNNDTVNNKGYDLAKDLYDLSGYDLLNSTGVDAAGYKDWAIDDRKIPSLTIEIGSQGVPLKGREAYSIFVRNLQFLPEMAEWVKKQ